MTLRCVRYFPDPPPPLPQTSPLAFSRLELSRRGPQLTCCNVNVTLDDNNKQASERARLTRESRDAAPSLSEGMERFVPHLTRREVEASHWALWQKPGEINGMVGEWLERVEKTRSCL